MRPLCASPAPWIQHETNQDPTIPIQNKGFLSQNDVKVCRRKSTFKLHQTSSKFIFRFLTIFHMVFMSQIFDTSTLCLTSSLDPARNFGLRQTQSRSGLKSVWCIISPEVLCIALGSVPSVLGESIGSFWTLQTPVQVPGVVILRYRPNCWTP